MEDFDREWEQFCIESSLRDESGEITEPSHVFGITCGIIGLAMGMAFLWMGVQDSFWMMTLAGPVVMVATVFCMIRCRQDVEDYRIQKHMYLAARGSILQRIEQTRLS